MRQMRRAGIPFIGAALLLCVLGCGSRGISSVVGPSASPTSASAPAAAVTPTPGQAVSAVSGTFDGCPPEGTALGARARRMNKLKNRSAAPSDAEIDRSVTMAALLMTGDDHDRQDEGKAAEVISYVARVLPGGKETTNCDALDRAHRDTHIELVIAPDDNAKNRRVIVEVTPCWRAAMQAQEVDWSTDSLKATIDGHCVRVRGWLLVDEEHMNRSEAFVVRDCEDCGRADKPAKENSVRLELVPALRFPRPTPSAAR